MCKEVDYITAYLHREMNIMTREFRDATMACVEVPTFQSNLGREHPVVLKYNIKMK